MTPPSPSPALPLTLRLAIAAVSIENLFVWVYVGLLAYNNADAPGGWRVIGFFVLYALAFSGLAWALIIRRRWVRAPLIVLQLLLVAVGIGLTSAGAVVVGVAVVVLAIACIGFLLAPATRAALGVR